MHKRKRKPIEIWKDIEGYEGIYQVSTWGRVSSLNYNNTNETKVLKNPMNNFGYPIVNLCKNGKKKQFKVHRLVAEAFIENPDNKEEVDHINTLKDDNRAINLRWVDRKENVNNPISLKHFSEARKGEKNPFYGKHHSEETKNKLSDGKKDKYCGENNPMYGKHLTHTEEWKKQHSKDMKEAWKRRKLKFNSS